VAKTPKDFNTQTSPNLWERTQRVGKWLSITASASTIVAMVYVGLSGHSDDFNPSQPSLDNTSAAQPFDQAAKPNEPAHAIDKAIQDALGQTTNLEAEGLFEDSDGNIFYHDWFVPKEVYEADVQTAQITSLPLSYILAVQSLESSFDPKAFNGIKACGLAQFVPETLAEKAYRYSPLIGFEGIRDTLIERTSTKIPRTQEQIDNGEEVLYNLTYDYVDTLSQHTLVETCWNPEFNTRLAAVMQIRDIGELQRDLAKFAPEGLSYYPVTELQAYTAHFAGGRAGENLLRDFLSNNGNATATDFFSQEAVSNTTNQNLLFHTKTVTDDDGNEKEVIDFDHPRTVTEFFKFLKSEKGLSDTPLPDFTDWNKIEAQISTKMAAIEPVYIQKETTVSYSPKPVPRPEGLGQIMAAASSPETRNSGAVETSLRPKKRPTDLNKGDYTLAKN